MNSLNMDPTEHSQAPIEPHLLQENWQNPYAQSMHVQEDFPFVYSNAQAIPLKGKWKKEFVNTQSPLHLEIGTGYGEFMHDFCQKNPHINFIGMDYRFKRSFHFVKKLQKLSQRNYLFIRGNAENIAYLFDESEISTLYYFFPDPWPKRRHHKKRLIQKPYLFELYKIIKPSGHIYIKTDNLEYFNAILTVLNHQNYFQVVFQTYDLKNNFPHFFLNAFTTKFESIFIKQKKPINALVLQSNKI